MNNHTRFITLLAAAAIAAIPTWAEVKPARILTDGMVVQRDRPVVLWGTADPGETFDVKAEKVKKASVTVTADQQGNWRAELPALKTGKTYTLLVGDKKISDVAVGDVLLCSGQSNMELPVRRVTDMFADEIASYSNPDIRHFIVPKEIGFSTPWTDLNGGQWKSVDEDAMEFSALAYFTAKELNSKTGLPVGIINASWGGTPVESWVSAEYLKDYPYYINQHDLYADEAYRKSIQAQEGRNYAAWNRTVDKGDPGLNGAVKYYAPELPDGDWTEMDPTVRPWPVAPMGSATGSHWLRRTVNIDAAHAGQPATLRLGCIVDADSVWVNGKQVGFTAYQYPPRIYKIPQGLLKEGENVIAIRVISNGGNPHFVAEKPYKIIFGDRPYAVYGQTLPDEISLEGKWRYRQGTPMPSGLGGVTFCYLPTVLFNSMIAPVAQYPVLGAVWYQGESNVGRSSQYPTLLDAMVRNWREVSGQPSMPIFVIELADFLHSSDKGGRAAWQVMRDRQAEACRNIPNAYLVKNSDLGEWNDIHPLDKKTLGIRTADAILSNTTK